MNKLLFVLILGGLLACAVQRPLSEDDPALFILQKTACFGTCPVYLMRIAADGRAYLHAKQFMDKQGIYTAKFDEETIQTLRTSFEHIQFERTFKESYRSSRSDLPTTYVTFDGYQVMDYDK